MPFASRRRMLISLPKAAESQTARDAATKVAKRKAKVRSAWISFAGRIVAQIVGAAATVAFALVVLHREPATHGVAVASAMPRTPLAPTSGSRPSVAVLPFQIYAASAEHNHIAGAITDLLVTDLAAGDELRVTSATSTLRYRTVSETVPEIARQLGVSHIVEGSIAVDRGRARINAQLIDAVSDQHVWARSYDAPLDDVLGMQERIAADVAQAVRVALAGTPARAN
jgi:TolB-like protein